MELPTGNIVANNVLTMSLQLVVRDLANVCIFLSRDDAETNENIAISHEHLRYEGTTSSRPCDLSNACVYSPVPPIVVASSRFISKCVYNVPPR